MTNLEKKLQSLLEPVIINLGYELYDVLYVKEGKDFYLRVFIDNNKGINLEDCEKVSNGISDLLDEADYIKDQYFLEVSSPGLEKVLRKDEHLKNNIGNNIEIKLFKPIEKNKILNGKLLNFDDNHIEIEYENNTISIDRNNIALIKTVYEW